MGRIEKEKYRRGDKKQKGKNHVHSINICRTLAKMNARIEKEKKSLKLAAKRKKIGCRVGV
jgi:hypothetical protein